MKNNAFKTFVRDTYTSKSPIPYIITIQVALFIVIHIFELIADSSNTSVNLYQLSLSKLSLPNSFTVWISQPWSLFTHPFIYSSILSLLFDSLWLFWIGNMFLNLLSKKHFLFSFLGGLLIGAVVFLVVGLLPFVNNPFNPSWSSITFGLTAILGSIIILSPKSEVAMMLFGVVKLKTIAFVYFLIQIGFLAYNKEYAAVLAFVVSTAFGIYFIKNLLNGKDWSNIFQRKKKRTLKVSYNDQYNGTKHKNDLSNQELIDQILDKISLNGYESLSKKEKEVLFKASRKD